MITTQSEDYIFQINLTHLDMHKRLLKCIAIILCIVSAGCDLAAQLHIINDKDGWTNVRNGPSQLESVTYILKKDEVFIADDLSLNTDEWIYVKVPIDKYSIGLCGEKYVSGYIHTSRIQKVESLPVLDSAKLKYEVFTNSFTQENRIIERNHNGFVSRIDGRYPWGTDGNLPNYFVENISIFVEDKLIRISPVLYCDIFEVGGSYAAYQSESSVFICQWNSDGAGGYQLIWVITDGQIAQRIISLP